MGRLLLALLLFGLTGPAHGKWNCSVNERIDNHLAAMVETLVDEPGPLRRHVDFYVHWSSRPGYMAEQQLAWIGVPSDETRLWKPDRYYLGIRGDRTDDQGMLRFTSPSAPVEWRSARGLVRSLHPHFQQTAITIEEPGLRTRLWEGRDWTVQYSDRRGQLLGSAEFLLPTPEVVQPLFGRMRSALVQKAADPQRLCRHIPEPTQEELEESQVHWGTRIRRPDLAAPEPVVELPED